MGATRAELADRVAEAALLRGTFTLRSGRTSHYYLDKYRLTTRPDLLRELGRMLAERVAPGSNKLAGAELGGVPLVTAASLETGLPTLLVRNARKDYGTAQQVEGELNDGDAVTLVEDVCTSGGQIIEAAQALEAAGAHVLRIVAVVDREEGAREAIEQAGYTFEALLSKTDLGV